MDQMMNQLLPFLANHWELSMAFVVILIAIFFVEWQTKMNGTALISPQTAVTWINHQDAVIMDIRPREAFLRGHVIGSKSVTSEEAIAHVEKYANKPLLIVCQQGISAQKTASALKKAGVAQVAVLKGGISAWQAADLPLEKK